MTEEATHHSKKRQPRKRGRSSWGVPRAKVAAGGAAGAVTVLVVFIVEELGLDVPPEVASAFTTLISFGAGYLKKGK